MKFKIALVFLAFLILLALVTLIVVFAVSMSDRDCKDTIIETRYQCSDGRFVSHISKCPTVVEALTTSVRKATTSLYSASTTTLCSCIDIPPSLTTLFTSTTTMWKGSPCSTDSDCGLATYGDIKCRTGDEHVFKNTPKCVRGYCMTLISTEFRKSCPESCRDGVGCVRRND